MGLSATDVAGITAGWQAMRLALAASVAERGSYVAPGYGGDSLAKRVGNWAPTFGGRSGFPPPEKKELHRFVSTGCTDTLPFQLKPNTPF